MQDIAPNPRKTQSTLNRPLEIKTPAHLPKHLSLRVTHPQRRMPLLPRAFIRNAPRHLEDCREATLWALAAPAQFLELLLGIQAPSCHMYRLVSASSARRTASASC